MKIGDVQIFEKKHEFKGAVISVLNRTRKSREEILEEILDIRGVESAKYVS